MRFVKTELCTVAGNGRGYLIITQGGNRLQSLGLLMLDIAFSEEEHAVYVAKFRPKMGGTNTVAGLRVAYLGPNGESHIRVLVSAEEAYQLFQREGVDDVITLIEHGIECVL